MKQATCNLYFVRLKIIGFQLIKKLRYYFYYVGLKLEIKKELIKDWTIRNKFDLLITIFIFNASLDYICNCLT